MKKLIRRSSAFIITLSMFLISTTYAGEVYVRYNESRQLLINNGKVYQRAFYDYGTWLPGDNARITAISKGSRTNYVSIKFSDYGNMSFERRRVETKYNKPAIADYLSDENYLEPGSYAYSEGRYTLDLNVID